MARLLAWVIPGFFLLPLAIQSDEPFRQEKEKLQGVWKLAALTINGMAISDDVLQTGQLEIKGNVGTVQVGDTMIKWQFKLDPLLKPKTIDLKSLMGDDKDEVYPGIYTLEGDRFVMCRPFAANNGRPDGFSADADSLCVLVIWERAKTQK